MQTIQELQTKLRSQRFYPKKRYLAEYKSAIEHIDDKPTRVYVKLIMSSGFRIGEVMNSYLYLDEDNNLILRAIAEKSYSITKHKFDHSIKTHSYSYSIDHLNNMFVNKQDAFKSVKLVNVLDLDLTEIKELCSTSFNEPRWIAHEFDCPSYAVIYRTLKSSFRVKACVYVNRLSEPTTMEVSPSFHFFRKLFTNIYNYVVSDKDLVKVVDYMKWTNPTIVFSYAKNWD